MPHLEIRTGVNPDEPDAPVLVLVVDPAGTPGERAVAKLGDYCYEGDEVLYLSRTDGWVEHHLDGDRLAVDIAVHPSALKQVGVDPTPFTGRSAVDPEVALVVRVEGVVDPERHAQIAGTVLYALEPGERPDGGEHWPILLAPPPGVDD
ncbi:hypothetical protein KZQ38_06490 [Saccharothrix sp. SC076]|nr:hypothetical protein [Saccharothrix obliqua]